MFKSSFTVVRTRTCRTIFAFTDDFLNLRIWVSVDFLASKSSNAWMFGCRSPWLCFSHEARNPCMTCRHSPVLLDASECRVCLSTDHLIHTRYNVLHERSCCQRRRAGVAQSRHRKAARDLQSKLRGPFGRDLGAPRPSCKHSQF